MCLSLLVRFRFSHIVDRLSSPRMLFPFLLTPLLVILLTSIGETHHSYLHPPSPEIDLPSSLRILAIS